MRLTCHLSHPCIFMTGSRTKVNMCSESVRDHGEAKDGVFKDAIVVDVEESEELDGQPVGV